MLSLSWILAAKNGVTLEERKLLMQESTMMWALALGNGTEEGSLYVQPDFREYRG
jgi:hypothetical protein